MNSTDTSGSAGDAVRAQLPQNGLAGLRHWRHDLLAGFVVSLVSLPLSSGIAIASGAPPIYGIISSIIAGLVFPLIGGSFVTISGPAAGLAPALLAIMVSLGGAGDADHVGAGYPMLLVVIFVTGIVQVVMARLGLARFAAIFPAAVVEGMLGAIGVLITVKALPMLMGYTGAVHAHGFAEYVASIPHWIADGHKPALAVGLVSLVVLFIARSSALQRFRLFQILPPHLFGAAAGALLAMVLGLRALDPSLLIEVPANPLDGIQLPAFGALWARPDLWKAAALGVVTLTLIDGVESLATAQAIDRIDPFQRTSVPGRVLAAMGLSNVISSLVGGLTIIPGGVKSKTNIEAGGRTLWANFANALFLLGFLFVAPALVALLPKAALGAILVYTGWKMVHPSIAKHLAEIGREQVGLYAITIVAILATDLLLGILIGSAAKLVLVAWHHTRARGAVSMQVGSLVALFQDPVSAIEHIERRTVLHVDKPVVCFNAYRLAEHIEQERRPGESIRIELGAGASVIDHTALESLRAMAAVDPGVIEVRGLEPMQARSSHPTAMRTGRRS
jgi:MFS superfamily sulfate permease-like transporter